MDSVVLLDILCRLRMDLGFTLQAAYVDHGISPNAAAWGLFCDRLCRDKNLHFECIRVDIAPHRHLGLEGAARQVRYQALAGCLADVVVVAQHQDDQAETLLLQLMRGAGAKGLSAMPQERDMQAAGKARLLRPLLDTSRDELEAYAREMELDWVDDESNSNVRLKRNFLRARVLPVLEEAFPGARAAIARSAANLADASQLLDDLARQDLQSVRFEDGLSIAKLLALGDARARNVLRHWAEQGGLIWPGASRLNELLRQLAKARPDARIDVSTGNRAFRAYRGMLYLGPEDHGVASCMQEWKGEMVLALPALGGQVRFMQATGRGISVAKLRGQSVTLRSREGGERLQPDCARPRRTLRNLFQEQGVPPWQRDRLPYLYCNDQLIAVAGIGTDCRWQAMQGEPGWVIDWEPVPRCELSRL
jgi:tRNA(Ile)-lysidine synthase